MGKFLKIFPLDPMFFRTPRPFTAGEQDWAPSNPLPLPGTLYGALRSMILSRRNFEQFVNGSGYEDIGTPENKGTLRLLTLPLDWREIAKLYPISLHLQIFLLKVKESGRKLKMIMLLK